MDKWTEEEEVAFVLALADRLTPSNDDRILTESVNAMSDDELLEGIVGAEIKRWAKAQIEHITEEEYEQRKLRMPWPQSIDELPIETQRLRVKAKEHTALTEQIIKDHNINVVVEG